MNELYKGFTVFALGVALACAAKFIPGFWGCAICGSVGYLAACRILGWPWQTRDEQ